MKVKATLLYRNGVLIDAKKLSPPVVGDLNVAAAKHPLLGRICVEANIHTDGPSEAIQSMMDVVLDSVSAHGFRLRGTEIGPKGAIYLQEWWCQPAG